VQQEDEFDKDEWLKTKKEDSHWRGKRIGNDPTFLLVYILGICNGIVICGEFSKAFEMLVVPKIKCNDDICYRGCMIGCTRHPRGFFTTRRTPSNRGFCGGY
jgi:hypothetical protein